MKKKLFCVWGLCTGLTVGLMACGGASGGSVVTEEAAAEAYVEEGMYMDNATDMVTLAGSGERKETEAMEEEGLSEEKKETATTQRKLIKTVNLNLETENYDSLMEGLEQQIHGLGGYIEYKDAYHGNYNSKRQDYSNRRASITARIPVVKLEEFTGKVAEIGNVIYESESVEDVTLKYVDLSSHKKMLVTEQERLMELLQNADTMEDIISLESRLSEVRYQIESMESQLRTYDNQVEYSTVHIEVEEVERYTPQPEKSTWERMKSGFTENVYRVTSGVKNFAIEFVIAIPILLVWAAVIAVGFFVVRLIVKKKHKKDIQETAKKQSLFHKENVIEESKEQ